MDESRAREFLRHSRSRFVREGLRWLEQRDDPVDLLFLLSRDLAEALGPYDTFRHAALLGLAPVPAVRELGFDVMAEPLTTEDGPPLHHALALGWAHAIWPEEEAPHAAQVLEQLQRGPVHGVHPALLLSSELALSSLLRVSPASRRAQVAAALDAEDAPAFAATLLEAICLAGLDDDLRLRCLERVAAGQLEDGGLQALVAHPVVRAMTTLRVLCLQKTAPYATAKIDEA